MMTLAIDASTKSTGVAIYDGKELKEYKCIINNGKNVLTRIKYMVDEIQKIYIKIPAKCQVIIEDVLPDNLGNNDDWIRNKKTFKPLMYLQAALMLMFNEFGIEPELIGTSSWRKRCGIKQGNAGREILKVRDIEFVKDKFGISVNDDIADAICIGWAKVNTEPEPAPFNWE